MNDSPTPQCTSCKWARGAFLWVMIVLVAVHLFATLGARSFWLDEIMQIRTAMAPSVGVLLESVPADKPPLHYLLLRLCAAPGRSEFLIRLPFFLTGLAIVAWAAGRGGFAALVGAAFLIIQPQFGLIAQEIIPYQIAALFAFGFVWFLSMALSGGDIRWMVAAAVMGAAAQLTNTLQGMTLLLLYAAAVPMLRNSPRRLMIAFAISASVHLAIFAALIVRQAAAGGVYPWKFPDVYRFAEILAQTFLFFQGIWTLAVSLAILALLFAGLRRAVMGEQGSYGRLMAVWLIAGLVVRCGVIWYQDHWLPIRYLFEFLVPLAIIFGYGLDLIVRRIPPAAGTAVIGILFLAFHFIRFSVWETEALNWPPYHEAVKAAVGKADVVAIDSDAARYCYEFYRDFYVPAAPLGIEAIEGNPDAIAAACAATNVYVFPLPSIGYYDEVRRWRFHDLRGQVVTGAEFCAYGTTSAPLQENAELAHDWHFASGFYPHEFWGDQKVRWMTPQGTVLFPAAGRTGKCRVKLRVHPLTNESHQFRSLDLSINGRSVGRFTLFDGVGEMESELFEAQELNQLRLTTDEPPRPETDPRRLSLAILQIRVECDQGG